MNFKAQKHDLNGEKGAYFAYRKKISCNTKTIALRFERIHTHRGV